MFSVHNTLIHLLMLVTCNANVQICKIISMKLLLFSYPSVRTYVLCTQKNRLIETNLLSNHNLFGLRNKKTNF